MMWFDVTWYSGAYNKTHWIQWTDVDSIAWSIYDYMYLDVNFFPDKHTHV